MFNFVVSFSGYNTHLMSLYFEVILQLGLLVRNISEKYSDIVLNRPTLIVILLCLYLNKSRSSSVSIVSDYGLDDRGSIPNRGRGFFF
jgi:hypothetical protein